MAVWYVAHGRFSLFLELNWIMRAWHFFHVFSSSFLTSCGHTHRHQDVPVVHPVVYDCQCTFSCPPLMRLSVWRNFSLHWLRTTLTVRIKRENTACAFYIRVVCIFWCTAEPSKSTAGKKQCHTHTVGSFRFIGAT